MKSSTNIKLKYVCRKVCASLFRRISPKFAPEGRCVRYSSVYCHISHAELSPKCSFYSWTWVCTALSSEESSSVHTAFHQSLCSWGLQRGWGQQEAMPRGKPKSPNPELEWWAVAGTRVEGWLKATLSPPSSTFAYVDGSCSANLKPLGVSVYNHSMIIEGERN